MVGDQTHDGSNLRRSSDDGRGNESDGEDFTELGREIETNRTNHRGNRRADVDHRPKKYSHCGEIRSADDLYFADRTNDRMSRHQIVDLGEQRTMLAGPSERSSVFLR